jgi:inner membrane protein
MNRINLILKAAAVGFLTLLLLIPLGMINGTISERAMYRQQAVESVARSFAGPQVVAGPVLVVPYEDAREVRTRDAAGVETVTIERTSGQWTYFPRTLLVDGKVLPDERKRGLHKVRVYELQAQLRARFDGVAPPAPDDPAVTRTLGLPVLSLSLADVRGLAGTPRLSVGGKAVELKQGIGDAREEGGVHATLAPVEPGGRIVFDSVLDLALSGTETLAIVPIGDSNDIRLRSAWPHPQFAGSFLPRERAIRADGFDARWTITALAAGSQRQYRQKVALNEIERLDLGLVDPVNIYSQADRATKYGVLFVALTFVGFFMFELIKRLPIHPIQYALVGLALAIFFLLLVSLSEHIEFAWAYLAASAACIGLLGFYLSAVLRSTARGLGFAAMLTVLYGALYGLLVSEDNALVLGSLLLFAILAAIMTLTRRIDWYALGRGEPVAHAVPPPRGEQVA